MWGWKKNKKLKVNKKKKIKKCTKEVSRRKKEEVGDKAEKVDLFRSLKYLIEHEDEKLTYSLK